MTLSKKRDRDRKRAERAKIRLDKLLCPPMSSSPVQPKPFVLDIQKLLDEPAVMPGFIERLRKGEVELDADGNVIPNKEGL